MIDDMLPTQCLRSADSRLVEPHRRLMAAVLQTVVDDCRGSVYRRARGYETPIGPRGGPEATAYKSSTDRTWPLSLQNLFEALGLKSRCLPRELQRAPD